MIVIIVIILQLHSKQQGVEQTSLPNNLKTVGPESIDNGAIYSNTDGTVQLNSNHRIVWNITAGSTGMVAYGAIQHKRTICGSPASTPDCRW